MRRVEITRFTWTPSRGKAVEIAPGVSFAAGVLEVDDPADDFLVVLEVGAVPMTPERGGRLVARSVSVRQRKDGPGVTSEAIRAVPVAGLLKEAAAWMVVEDPKPSGKPRPLWSVLDTMPHDIATQGPTDDALRWVALIYRIAAAAGEGPTKAVEELMGLTRPTAGRWVAAARDRGFLGAAEGPGKAGG